MGPFEPTVAVEENETTATVKIPIRTDNLTEVIETVIVKITNPPPGWIPKRVATGAPADQTTVYIGEAVARPDHSNDHDP